MLQNRILRHSNVVLTSLFEKPQKNLEKDPYSQSEHARIKFVTLFGAIWREMGHHSNSNQIITFHHKSTLRLAFGYRVSISSQDKTDL